MLDTIEAPEEAAGGGNSTRARRVARLVGNVWIIGSGLFIAARSLPGLVTALQRCAHCRCCPVRQADVLAAEHAAGVLRPHPAQDAADPAN